MSASSRGTPAASSGRELSPGDHLRREIDRLGLDQVSVSKATGVSRQTINNIVNGRQPISRAMAAKLGRLMGRSSDYWLQDSYARRGQVRHESKRRPIGVLVNHQIVRAVRDGILGIEPFDATNVRPAAIALTLGGAVITTHGRPKEARGGKKFVLAPGRAAQVRTKERIGFPSDYVGRVGAMPRLVTSGVVTSAGFQVAPGFKGYVQVCIFNAGGKPFRLNVGEPILSLEITALGVAPEPEPV